MSNVPIRILIVENQRFVADAIEALLNQQPGMVVVGKFGLAADPNSGVQELKPDIVILDFRPNDEMATAIARAIGQTSSDAKMIFLTSEACDSAILAAVEVGASAVLHRTMAAGEVLDAIRNVANGETLIPPGTIATLLNNHRVADSVRSRLTTREREILNMMAAGASNREIAARLEISYVTVRSHVRHLALKLAAHSKLEVLVRARELDLVARQSTTRVA